MADWNAFTVFKGTCVLNKDVFKGDRGFGISEWVDNLRADTLQGGIPQERGEDVARLLNKFFPTGSQPLLVASKQSSQPNTDRDADPVTVTYGASTININDGPSALGYIFSIAASTATLPRTYDNYAVPLLAIYARFLYLAYIYSDGGLPNITNVPVMCNCMYTLTTGANPAFHLLLGSTYRAEGSKILMMNGFRRGIVNGGLSQYSPAHALPLEPRLRAGARSALKKYLRGVIPNQPGTNLWIPGTTEVAKSDPLIEKSEAKARFNELATQWKEEWQNANGTLIAPLRYGSAVSSHSPTAVGGPSIVEAIDKVLDKIIEKRWKADYTRKTGWLEVLPLVKEFYIQVYIPYMFLLTIRSPTNPSPKPDFTQPPVSLPTWTAHFEADVDKKLASQKDMILGKLDHIHSWISGGTDNLSSEDGGPDHPRYGRCAETHPVVSLMPNYIPDRVIPPAADPSPVRGFAFEVRRFDNLVEPSVITCNNLSVDFSGATLNGFHAARARNAVYRLPCDNCRELLPEMDVPVVGQNTYNADMQALNPTGFSQIR